MHTIELLESGTFIREYDSHRLLVGQYNGHVQLVDIDKAQIISTFNSGHDEGSCFFIESIGNNRFVASNCDSYIQVLEIKENTISSVCKREVLDFIDVVAVYDNSKIYASIETKDKSSIQIFDIIENSIQRPIHLALFANKMITTMCKIS